MLTKKLSQIKDLLDEKVVYYNQRPFIEQDPISIPHLFTKKEDREIAGFLAATIAWGNRRSILNNAMRLMNWMDMNPHDFILNHSEKDTVPFKSFVHRTFNGTDCLFFIRSLQNIYKKHGGLEAAFDAGPRSDLKEKIMRFRKIFLEVKHPSRSEKHISDPGKKSSAKRLCMFLRWMVRNDKKGVDFGIWKNISSSELCLPLDVHTGNISRKLGLLTRKQNDWQAVEEITNVLRSFDPKDPVKYDFALFGMGVNRDI
jgi:uncharacterized protein (TIGR02757 family)